MIRLKKRPRRSLRDRNDDLSIVTGGRAPIHLKGVSAFKEMKRQRLENEKLLHGNRRGLGPDANGHWTINCVPPLITLADTRRAVQASQQKRRELMSANFGSSQHMSAVGSQNSYWSSYGNTRRTQRPITASSMFCTKVKRNSGNSSAWKITSSMPMTRETASMVQMEVAAAMSTGQNSSSARSSFSIPSIRQSPLDHLGLTSTQPSHVIPTLVKGVRPPPSPLFPVVGSVSLNGSFSSGGVYQSEWIDRSKCLNQEKAFTKQFSIEQLMDIMCGFATPDSIMASKLFDPFPTTASASSVSSESSIFAPTFPCGSSISAISTTLPLKDNQNHQDFAADNENDDGETSIYFRKSAATTKKKSVSFLTDTQDNICVTKHIFDPFSQEFSGSGSGVNSFEDKENMDPSNMFANVIPPSSQRANNLIFNPTPSSVFSPLRECNGRNRLENRKKGITPNNNQDTTSDFGFPYCNSESFFNSDKNSELHSADYGSNSNAFPTLPVPASPPLFEFANGSTVASSFSPGDFEKIHPSWNDVLNGYSTSFFNGLGFDGSFGNANTNYQ